MNEFRNEPLADFQNTVNREAFDKALNQVRSGFGKTHPIIIGGREVMTDETFASVNPSRKSEVVSRHAMGTVDHIERAIDAGWRAFRTWSLSPVRERADLLLRAASMMRQRKHAFSALMVFEEGKNRVEADADTAEAIDFLEFYAREALRYAERQPITEYAGEDNELIYIPLGVGAVVPPWNFPLAILCGMTAAAVVTGNCVVLKPASDSPAIGYAFFKLMEEAGCPPGVVNFVTGRGASIGDALVGHPRTRFISFTGSMEVGLHINELAARHAQGQKWIKRVIAEMGGKDAIVVDKDADLDAAASSIVASAYGFTGQKCSACSRAIVHEAVYDRVVDLIVEGTRALRVGDSANHETQMGPLVSESAKRKTLEYIEIGKKEGRLVFGGNALSDEGFFVAPTVFADVVAEARLSKEEIFGPVLAVTKAKDFDDALGIANNTDFGLTGSVYTASRANWEKAKREFHVGNLYRNRRCTGALVGVHPFGGFNLSGTDSKAGGRDYLLLFMQAKTISEKLKS